MQREPSESGQLAESAADRGVSRIVGRFQHSLAELTGRVHALLRDPIDVASLVFFRIAFGAMLLWEVVRCLRYDSIARFSIEPTSFDHYSGFDWVRAWPGEGMTLHFAALGLLAILITIGCCYRLATVLFFLGFSYVYLLDQANFVTHSYLILHISFLLILLPAHAGGSVDAWLRRRVRRRFVPGWSLRIVQTQIGLVYLFSGLAKLNSGWLSGRSVAAWLSQYDKLMSTASRLAEPAVGWTIAYGGLLFDLAVVPLLCWRKTRPYAFVLAVLVHAADSQLFNLGTFPWFMIAATAMFFPSDWPRRFLPNTLGGRRLAVVASPLSFWQRAGVAFTVIYLPLQIAMPFQHLLYPVNPNWNEREHQTTGDIRLHSENALVATKDVFTVSALGTEFESAYGTRDDLVGKTLERRAAADEQASLDF